MKNLFCALCCLLCICSCNTLSSDHDHPLAVDRIIDSAQRVFDAGGQQTAMQYLDNSYAAFAGGPGDLFRKYEFKKNCFHKIAIYHEHKKDYYARALIYADSMLLIIKEHREEYSYLAAYAEANFALGDILFDMGRYEQSYQYYYNGKLIAEARLDSCAQSNFISRFAVVCYRQEKYPEAAVFFKKAFAASVNCKMDFSVFAARQGLLDNAGLSYHKAGITDSALKYYHLALAYIDRYEGLFPEKKVFCQGAKGVVYGNQAMLYYQSGDTAMAETLLKQSIAINRSGDEKMDAQVTQLKLAALYLASGRMTETEALLGETGRSLDSMPNVRARLTWLKLQADYYLSVGQPAAANAFLRLWMQVLGALDIKDKRMLSADAGLELEDLQKQDELKVLKTENAEHRRYFIFTMFLSLMGVCIIFLLWRNWRTSKKHNATLIHLNREILTRNGSLQKALSDLEQSQQQNTRMMKIVAHDLRSPVGAIVSLAEWMMEHRDDNREELLPLIHKTAGTALDLIAELMHFNTTVSDMFKEVVELDALLQYCVSMLQPKAAEKGQQVALHAMPAVISGDQEKLWRVFGNLLSNAVKFSPEHTRITVKMHQEGNTIITAIQDQGIGIPDELKDKLFSGSPAIKRKGTAGEASFGLGLSIARQIVEAHGGMIWFDSHLSEGTSFYVQFSLLPVRKDHSSPNPVR